MKRKIPKKDFEILESIKCEPGFERILWAYTGSKRGSSFNFGVFANKVTHDTRSKLKDLGVKVTKRKSGRQVYKEGWLDENNRSISKYFDYPDCCADNFFTQNDKRTDRILNDYPFDGISSLKDAIKKTRSMEKNDAMKFFHKDLAKHTSQYSKDYPVYHHQIRTQIVEETSSRDLPEYVHLFDFMAPCKIDCESFLSQAERMYEDLKMFGEEFADSVVNDYRIATGFGVNRDAEARKLGFRDAKHFYKVRATRGRR